MIGDNRTVSEEFLKELVSIGLSAQDIEDALVKKMSKQLREHGIVNRIPAREAFDSYFRNINNATSHRVYLSQSSIQTYRPILEEFYAYCEKASGGEAEVQELMTYVIPFLTESKETVKTRLAPATLNKYTAVLRSFIYETAFHYKLIEGRMPRYLQRIQNLPQALSDREVSHLLEIASTAQYGLRSLFMISFFLSTGVRRDEFRGIRRGDIDLTSSSVRVHGKGDRDRIVHIPTNLRTTMTSYFDAYGITSPKQYVYTRVGSLNEQIGRSTLDDTAQRLFRKLPSYERGDRLHSYHLHTLRHTYAVALLRGGVSLRTIAQALGHRSVRSTEIYTVLNTEQLREQLKPGLNQLSKWWGGNIYE